MKSMRSRLTVTQPHSELCVAMTDLPAGQECPTRSLSELSVRIGQNPMLAQAATGNTSEKIGGILWIKASGKWLADANRPNMFVPVRLEDVAGCLHGGEEIALEYEADSGEILRSSIETAMHAVIPHRVTIHVHSVNAIAMAICRDGRQILTSRLNGLQWQWIPYVSSGIPLAQRIAAALSINPALRVFVLANHGLVVCGNSCDEAESLLDEVEERLFEPPRPAPSANRSLLDNAAGAGWFPAEAEVVHSLGTDGATLEILRKGILYPCQAVFLGNSAPVVDPCICAVEAKADWHMRHGVAPRFLILEGAGVLIGPEMSRSETEILRGLAQVLQRVSPAAQLRYLSPAEIEGVMTNDARKYRRLVDSNAAPADPVGASTAIR